MRRSRTLTSLTVLLAAVALTVTGGPAVAAEDPPRVLHAGEALVAGTDHFALGNGWYSLEVYPGEVSLWETLPVRGSGPTSSWTTSTWGRTDPTGRFHAAHDHTELRLRRNGDLALVTSRGHQLWHSATAGSGAVRLTLRRGGNLVLTTGSGHRVWSSLTGQAQMSDGMRLAPGHRLRSNLGVHPRTLTMQVDGNLVYRCGSRIDWQTHTHVRRSTLRMGGGGNLRIVSPRGRTVWTTHSGGHDYAHLDSIRMYVETEQLKTVWYADTGPDGC